MQRSFWREFALAPGSDLRWCMRHQMSFQALQIQDGVETIQHCLLKAAGVQMHLIQGQNKCNSIPSTSDLPSPFDSVFEGAEVLFSTSAAATRTSRSEALPSGGTNLCEDNCRRLMLPGRVMLDMIILHRV